MENNKQQRAERYALLPLRQLADQAFSRAAGAHLIGGNHVRLLKDAKENYPAWLEAIRAAKNHVHFENYIFCDDNTGREFADSLIDKAREGVSVRLIYDWLGCLGKASPRFWNALRSGGVEVRCYNPLRLDRPLGWISRDHRKMLAIDGEIAFIAGLCIGQRWLGDPERMIEPWRDTGVEIRGSSVIQVEQAFARIWAWTGEPLSRAAFPETTLPEGEMSLRIVASEPATTGMIRLDQLIAALARKRLWLTDAYYGGTATYMEALRAAANDGVDVRLLLPNTTDIPLLQPLSRTGYRPLLEAGVRLFEWNGTMLHAKTAVADGTWARVGSTNLNIASWIGNCELDVIVEDESFGAKMEEMYEQDLAHATEIVLDRHRRPHAATKFPRKQLSAGVGSASRAAAGVVRIGNTLGTTLINRRRVFSPIGARLTAITGLLLFVLSVLFALFPKALAYPLVALGAWGGLTLLYRGYQLAKQKKTNKRE
ncbi:MAG: phospholipase D-like domain-containing protein [Thermoguttaceae bacterium]